MSPPGRRAGFTVVELLVVIAIVGILGAIAALRVSAPGPRLFASDLRAQIQQARYEAVKRNRPVAVIWIAGAREFRTVIGPDGTYCGQDVVLARRSLDTYPRLTLDTDLADGGGIVWLPSGQARSCTLGTFSPVIATIGDGVSERVVTVTLTGRVEVQ